MKSLCLTTLAGLLLWLLDGPAPAGEADVIDVQVQWLSAQAGRFSVTVKHADSGWEHYADRWEILTPDGRLLAVRTLYHPHVDEQPFTRSLSPVKIPAGLDRVLVRAHDKVHGYGGRTATVRLQRPQRSPGK